MRLPARASEAPALTHTPRSARRRDDDLVDDPVFLGLVAAHEEVAVEVLGDLGRRLAGVLRVDLVDRRLEALDLVGLDLDVRRRALRAAPRLVEHDPRVREG